MGVAGNARVDPPRDRLAHAFRGDNPDRVLQAARGVPGLTLDDAVRISEVLVRHGHPLADRACGRLVGRLLVELRLELEDADVVMAAALGLPDRACVDQLLGYARRP